MVTRSVQVYDDDFLTVSGDSPFLTPGDTVANFDSSANGAIFEFQGGAPVTVTLDDTSADPDTFEDNDSNNHTITDGAGLVADGSGVESESTLWLVEIDEFGNQVGPAITLTIFSRGGVQEDVWGFHSDIPLIAGRQYQQTSGSPKGSTAYANLESQPVCYAKGSWIETPDGQRKVETLLPGDLVMTADHGAQPILWVHSSDSPLDRLEVDQRPVLIAACALGKDAPAQDLIVSPQHRILVGGGGQLVRYFDTEVFVPAKALTRLPGIRHMKGKEGITWVHFACGRHEVVTVNGCLSESLLLGPMVLDRLTRAERKRVFDIFGAARRPKEALNGAAARTCLTVREVFRRLANHGQSNNSNAAKEIRKWDVDAAMERYEAERLCTREPLNNERTKSAA